MAVPEFLAPFRGDAGGWADVQALGEAGPLGLISNRLYVARHDEPEVDIERFKVPVLDIDDFERPMSPIEATVAADALGEVDVDHWKRRAFLELMAGEKCFAIGGTMAITRIGYKAAWLRDHDVRDEVQALIEMRGWSPLLKTLKGRENEKNDDLDLIGQKEISKYFAALPPPFDRSMDSKDEKKDKNDPTLSPLHRRNRLCMRLRKAIELILHYEVALAHRFNKGQSENRFAMVSGLWGAEHRQPSYLYNHLWLEPVIYSIDPLPHATDVARIVEAEEQSLQFTQTTGQDTGILFRILFGAPCTYGVAVAAAKACNKFYGRSEQETQASGAALHRPSTIRPHAFKLRKAILDEVAWKHPEGNTIPSRYRDKYEDLLLPGVIAPEPSAAQSGLKGADQA